MRMIIEPNMRDWLRQETWAGGRDTVNTVDDADKLDDLIGLIEEAFCETDEPPTQTQVNDFLWFDREFIYETLGIEE